MIKLGYDPLLRVLTIDNGSNTLGASVTDIDLDNEEKTVIFSETICAEKSAWRYQDIADIRGGRFARMQVLKRFVSELLEEYNPEVVAIESPFLLKRMPESFAVLREVIVYLQQAVHEYDPGLSIILVPPINAKKAVNALSCIGKDPVRDAVLMLNDVYYVNDLDPHLFDEHQIDSIAVMYFIADEYISHLKRRRKPKHAPERRAKGGRRK